MEGLSFEKIADEFGLKRQKPDAFNDSIQKDIEDRRVFNSKYLYRVPEEIKSNIDFFSALRIVGITPMAYVLKPVFSPHNNRFNLLDGVVMRGTHKVIQQFHVPEHCNKLMHKSAVMKLMNYDGVKVVGKGDSLLYRARHEISGPECVIFGVALGDEYHYYMWDVDSIYRVEATGPAVFKRVDGRLLLLSDPSLFSCELEYDVLPWENLNMELVESADAGIVVSVDLEEYKILRDPTVVVQINQGIAKSKTGVICDNVPLIYNGKYEMSVNSNEVYDEVKNGVVCSHKEYDVIKKCAFSYKEIYDFLYVSPDRVEFTEKLKISVDSTSTFYRDLNKGKIRVASLIDTGALKDFSSRMGNIKRQFASDDGWCQPQLPYSDNKRGYVKNGKYYCLSIYKDTIIADRGWDDSARHVLIEDNHNFCREGMSDYYQRGWKCVVILSDDQEIRRKFERQGLCMLYYDPKKWYFDSGDDDIDFT